MNIEMIIESIVDPIQIESSRKVACIDCGSIFEKSELLKLNEDMSQFAFVLYECPKCSHGDCFIGDFITEMTEDSVNEMHNLITKYRQDIYDENF